MQSHAELTSTLGIGVSKHAQCLWNGGVINFAKLYLGIFLYTFTKLCKSSELYLGCSSILISDQLFYE